MEKTALFTNFSNESFTGFWDGKPKTFAPGKSIYMPDFLAKHFAKHLVNRELLKVGKERDTSPKVKVSPTGVEYVDNKNFMELFEKAYQVDKDEAGAEAPQKDSIDVAIEVANRNRGNEEKVPAGVQIASFPEDDEDDEESFGGKPVDPTSSVPKAGAN